MSQTQIIAHRGSSRTHHENTLAAFEGAVRDGADGIEFDIRLTRDRRWVVHHDASVLANGIQRPIADLTSESVQGLRVGPNADSIPVVEDFLAWSRDREIQLVFDIKDRVGVPELVEAVEGASLALPPIFSSFHRSVLKELEVLRPSWSRALIVGDPRSTWARRLLLASVLRWARRHKIMSLHFEEHWIRPSLIALTQTEGIRVAVWTVDDPLRMALLAALGVDAIITNRPDLAYDALRQTLPPMISG